MGRESEVFVIDGDTVMNAPSRPASPKAAVGSELMLEHLHPNVDGYFVLADAFHDSLLAGRSRRCRHEGRMRSPRQR